MTLHWWMHWFWVTTLLTFQECGLFTLAAPQSEELQHIPTDLGVEPTVNSERQGRAMYLLTKSTPATTTKIPPNITNITTNPTEKPNLEITNATKSKNSSSEDSIDIVHPSVIEWTQVNTTAKTNINETEIKNITDVKNDTNIKETTTDLNETQNLTFDKKINLTRLDIIKDDSNVDGVSESRIVTEKPLSLETSLLQTRIPPNVESSRRIIDPGEGGLDTGAIAGISFATLVLGALAGSTAFVMYRRRYLNKPQTLNDKCSNPDSSGYLDDSTIRDNSEEMYSLDNDSFLNSLEAMTIQNYWTDTVKHTKL